MTRVEGENSRLRHYLARLNRKTFCYSKSDEMLCLSVKLLGYYLKNKNLSLISMFSPASPNDPGITQIYPNFPKERFREELYRVTTEKNIGLLGIVTSKKTQA